MKKLSIIFVALFLVSGARAQWFPLNSGTTNNLYSVYFADANKGYAVGDSGTILKTTDGVNWVAQNSGTDMSLHSVYFLDLMTGFCVGDSGTIIKTTNGGSNWNLHKVDSTIMLHSVHFPGGSIGYIAGGRSTWVAPYNTIFDAIILKSVDFGENWTENFTTEGSLSSICFPSLEIGFAGGGVPGTPGYAIFLRTIDGGENWTEIFPGGQGFHSLCFTSNGTGYAVNDDNVFKTNDSGSNWSSLGWLGALNSIYFLNNGIGYGVGYNYIGGDGRIYKTADDGENWYIQDSILPAYPSSVHFPVIDTGYIVGWVGMILKTSNGGGFPLDIMKSNSTNSLAIYPNPSANHITVKLPDRTSPNKNTIITLFNLDGQALLSRPITEPQTVLDVSDWVSGIYYVKVTNDKESRVAKFVKN